METIGNKKEQQGKKNNGKEIGKQTGERQAKVWRQGRGKPAAALAGSERASERAPA